MRIRVYWPSRPGRHAALKTALITCYAWMIATASAQTSPLLSEPGAVLARQREAQQKLMQRLFEIAEGPPPTKAALEAEFGFVYQKCPSYNENIQCFYATGKLPFNSGDSGGHTYFHGLGKPPSYIVNFKFAQQEVFSRAGIPRMCISATALKALFKPNWTRHFEVVQPHALQYEGYVRTKDGFKRSVGTAPTIGDGCITEFGISYHTVPEQREASAPSSTSTTNTINGEPK